MNRLRGLIVLPLLVQLANALATILAIFTAQGWLGIMLFTCRILLRILNSPKLLHEMRCLRSVLLEFGFGDQALVKQCDVEGGQLNRDRLVSRVRFFWI